MAQEVSTLLEAETNSAALVQAQTEAVVESATNAVTAVSTNFVEALGTTLTDSTEKVSHFVGWLKTEGPRWLATDGLALLLTVVLAVLALRLARLVASRLTVFLARGKHDSESKKRADTLGGVIRWALHITVYIVAGMMVLKKLGLEIGPIIAAAGIVGLALGFGAQTLVQDVISGFFVLLEDQVRVGDVVSLNDKSGLVERITLRTIVLRDLSGNVHYVRNGQISVITNMTKDFSHYVFDVGVAYREDVDQVIQVLKGIDEDIRRDSAYRDDILAPLEVLGLDKFDSSAVVIKARIKTKPIQQWRVGREFNRRMKIKFDELGIEIPFPHLTVYAGKDKKGESPAFVIQSEADGFPRSKSAPPSGNG
jgi:small conductance mechanosensitive channel